MATLNSVVDEYVFRPKVDDQASAGVDSITAKLKAFEPAAQAAAAAADAVNQKAADGGGIFGAASTRFDAFAKKYDDVTRAALALKAAQNELERATTSGQAAIDKGTASQEQYDATVSGLAEKISRLATNLGNARASAEANADSQAAWNGQIGQGRAAVDAFATSVAASAEATKSSQIAFADWMNQGQASNEALTRLNANLANYTAGLQALRARFDPVFSAQQTYRATLADIATAENQAGLAASTAATARSTASTDMAKALDAQRAAIDPLFAVSKQYEAKLNDINAAEQAQIITESRANLLREQAAASLAGASVGADKLTNSAHDTSGAVSGITREMIVLGHEVIVGNYTRLTGSLLVMTEYLGDFRTAVFSFFTTPLGIATAAIGAFSAGVAALATSGARQTSQLHTLQQEIRGVSDNYVQLGIDATNTAKAIAASTPLSNADAKAGVAAFRTAGGTDSLSDDQVSKFVLIAASASTALGVSIPEAEKKFAGALQDAGALAQEFASKGLFGMNQAFADSIKLQVQGGDTAGAYARVLDQVGAKTHGALDPTTEFGKAMKALDDAMAGTTKTGKSFSEWLASGFDQVGATAVLQIKSIVDGVNKVRGVVAGIQGVGSAGPDGVLQSPGPNSHALGLGQIQPGTASGLGINPLDAADNVKGVFLLLQQLQQKFGANNTAIGAYNVGPNANLSLPATQFESRNYAAQVNGADISKLPADTAALIDSIGASNAAFASLVPTVKRIVFVESSGNQYKGGSGLQRPADAAASSTASPASGADAASSGLGNSAYVNKAQVLIDAGNVPTVNAAKAAADVQTLQIALVALGDRTKDNATQFDAFHQRLDSAQKSLYDAVPATDAQGRALNQQVEASQALTAAYAKGLPAAAETEARNQAMAQVGSTLAKGTGEYTVAVEKQTQQILAAQQAQGQANIAGQIAQTDQATQAQQKLAAAYQSGAGAVIQVTAENEASAQLIAQKILPGNAAYDESLKAITASLLAKGAAEAQSVVGSAVAGLEAQTKAQDALTAAYARGPAAVVELNAAEAAETQLRTTKLIPGTVAYAIALTNLTDAHLKETEAATRTQAASASVDTQSQIAMVQLETSTLGMNSDQRTLLLSHVQAEVDLRKQLGPLYDELGPKMLAERDQLAQLNLTYQNTQANLSYLSGQFSTAFDTIGNAMTQAFFTGQKSAVNWGNVMSAVVQQVIQQFLKLAVLNPFLNALFNQSNPTLTSVFAALGAGGSPGGATGASSGGLAGNGSLLGTASSVYSAGKSVYGYLAGGSAGSSAGLFGYGNGLLSTVAHAPLYGSVTEAGNNAALAQLGEGIYGPATPDAALAASGGGNFSTLAATALPYATAIGGGFALGSLAGGEVQKLTGKTGVAPEVGAGVGAIAGTAIGTVILPGVGTVVGGLIGGLAGGAGGGLIGPSVGSSYSGTLVSANDNNSQLTQGATLSQHTSTYYQGSPEILHLTDEVNSLNDTLKVNNVQVSGALQVGLNSNKSAADPNKYGSLDAGLGNLHFSSANANLNDKLSQTTFASVDQFNTWIATYNTLQYQTADYLVKTATATAGFGKTTGTLNDAIAGINTTYDASIATAEALKASNALSTEQINALTVAEGTLNDQRAQAIAIAAEAANAQLKANDVSLTSRLLTADVTLGQGGYSAGDVALYSFDQNASVEKAAFSKSLIDTFGDAYKGTQGYADQIKLEEDTLGAERLAIQKGYNDQITSAAQQAAATAAQTASGVIASLNSWLSGLAQSSSSPLSPLQKYRAAQTDFNTTSSGAAGGDAKSIQALQNSGTSLLTAAQSYYGSSANYAAVFNQVTDAVKKVGDLSTDTLTASFLALQTQTQTATLVEQLQSLQAEVEQLQSLQAEVAGLRSDIARGSNMPARLAA